MKVLVVERSSEDQAALGRRLDAIDRIDKDILDLQVSLANEASFADRLADNDVVIFGAGLEESAPLLARKAKVTSPSIEVLIFVSAKGYSGSLFRTAISRGARKVLSESARLLDVVQELMSIQEEFRLRGKHRSGKIIAVVTKGDTQVRELADHVIEIPETSDALSPLLTTIPLQLLSYHIAVMRGCNVDQPRNLAKSVTVE